MNARIKCFYIPIQNAGWWNKHYNARVLLAQKVQLFVQKKPSQALDLLEW